MLAVCIPGSLFLVSFVTLMIITQTVRVGDDARMRCKWCTDADTTDRIAQYEAVAKNDDDRTVTMPGEFSNQQCNNTDNVNKDEVAMHDLNLKKKEDWKVNLLERNVN